MKYENILKHVDHTLLTQTATWDEIRQICDDAIAYQTASGASFTRTSSSIVSKIRSR